MVNGYTHLGNGPTATGVSLDPTEYGACECGALSKDIDAGRFGSSLGDQAIEIYRKTDQ